jgi:hypothetical protein
MDRAHFVIAVSFIVKDVDALVVVACSSVGEQGCCQPRVGAAT